MEELQTIKFKCHKCSKLYVYNKALETHLKKCGELEVPRKFPCKYCNKEFSYQPGKSLHEKTCKSKNNNSVTASTTTNINSNNNQTNYFNITNIGSERLPRISKEEILKIFSSGNPIENGFNYLYSIPENHNLLITNPSSDFANCISNGKQKKVMKDTIIRRKIDTLFESLMVLFFEYYYTSKDDSHFSTNKDLILNTLKSLQIRIIEKNFSQKFIKEFSALLYNYKELVKSTWLNKEESDNIEFFDKDKYLELIKELKYKLLEHQGKSFRVLDDELDSDDDFS